MFTLYNSQIKLSLSIPSNIYYVLGMKTFKVLFGKTETVSAPAACLSIELLKALLSILSVN